MNKRVFVSFALVALLLVVAIPLWAFSKEGSSGASPADVPESDEHAKELFADNCGSCHTLALAGTDGVVGPDLDERLAGTVTGEPTPEGIEANRSRVITAIEDGVGDGAMPAGILQGAQAEQVADFVARVAGQ